MLSGSRCTTRLMPIASSRVISSIHQVPSRRHVNLRSQISHLHTRSRHATKIPLLPYAHLHSRNFQSDSASELPLPNSRWLSDLYTKLRKAPNHEQLLEEVKANATGLMLGVEGYGMVPFHTEPVTWGDQDAMGHVNNVIYNKWAEAGRVSWCEDVAASAPKEHRSTYENMMNPQGFGLILQMISTTYKFPLKYPDTVLVAHKLLGDMTEESKFMELEAVAISQRHQRIAARFVERINFYDYRIGKTVQVPPPLLEQLTKRKAALLETQQEARRKVLDLERRVDRLIRGEA